MHNACVAGVNDQLRYMLSDCVGAIRLGTAKRVGADLGHEKSSWPVGVQDYSDVGGVYNRTSYAWLVTCNIFICYIPGPSFVSQCRGSIRHGLLQQSADRNVAESVRHLAHCWEPRDRPEESDFRRAEANGGLHYAFNHALCVKKTRHHTWKHRQR